MNENYWQKQTDKPLFPELEWNKPERRDQAGRLLLVGGSTHALSAPALAYAQAKSSGIGDVKIVLPSKTKGLIDKKTVDAVFLSSTPSGEFAQDDINELLEYSLWADTLLLTGDVGKNSQTSILLEELLRSFTGITVVTKDSIESLFSATKLLFEREKTTLVVSFNQLQKLLQNYEYKSSLSSTMGIVQLVEFLKLLTEETAATIITLHNAQLVAAHDGKVTTTKTDDKISDNWPLEIASKTVCYQTWNPKDSLKSATQSIFELLNND